ncbi:MAG: bifunctional phosphopantothenoylcysteine decarboxylase/phosphopantothenate--cysteine ligase CoaBC, partial [Bacteroidota bacterium]
YVHPSTTNNIDKLVSYGNLLVDAEEGELASGLDGKGRMAEPEHLLNAIKAHFHSPQTASLNEKKVLITSGPTYEAIDPVRFIGNHSSGRMGHALAKSLHDAGCDVTVISGPSSYNKSTLPYRIENVTSADDMYQQTLAHYPSVDIAIFAAAVADYRPKDPATQKIKKTGDEMTINLIKNKDIAFEMGKLKKHQINIGFALETENEQEHALAKLTKKNFDLIVLNSLRDKGAGFASDTNKVTILGHHNINKEFELKSKDAVAKDIIYEIANLLDR